MKNVSIFLLFSLIVGWSIFLTLQTPQSIIANKQLKNARSTGLDLGIIFPTARNLQNSDNDADDEQNKDKNKKGSTSIHLIMVLVALGLVFVGGCIVCIVCVVRKVLGSRRGGGGIGGISRKIANISLSYDYIFPIISYQLFKREVGKPLQDSCVICLEEFQCNNGDNTQLLDKNTLNRGQIYFQSPQIMSKKEQRSQFSEISHKSRSLINRKTAQYKKATNNVKYTVCGHLLHQKCLNDWLIRQENCPLCRQSFSEDNIAIWEQKIGFSFQDTYEDIFNNEKANQRFHKKYSFGKDKKNFKKSKKIERAKKNLLASIQPSKKNPQFTVSELSKQNQNILQTKSRAIYEEGSQLSRKVQASQDFSTKQLYALAIYCTIMQYYEGRKNIEEIMIEENFEQFQGQMDENNNTGESNQVLNVGNFQQIEGVLTISRKKRKYMRKSLAFEEQRWELQADNQLIFPQMQNQQDLQQMHNALSIQNGGHLDLDSFVRTQKINQNNSPSHSKKIIKPFEQFDHIQLGQEDIESIRKVMRTAPLTRNNVKKQIRRKKLDFEIEGEEEEFDG